MLDRVKYVNSKGQVIEFGEAPYYINYNDLRNYSWNYTADSSGSKIISFSRGIKEKTLPVKIIAPAGQDCTQYKNKLFSVIEYDTLYNTRGKLFIGDFYLEGFFIGSEKSAYLEHKNTMTLSLKFVAESTGWKRITSKSFKYSEDSDAKDEPFLTYPYDHPYDYKAGNDVLLLENESDFECDFVMRIYGQVTNPLVTIGANDYTVETTVYQNEFLVINSREQTVVRYLPDGTAIDEFNNRSRVSNVFNKIPAGQNTLRHNVSNGIDIDLIDERSEPLWT